MLRTFSEHFVRRCRTLDGPWDFIIDPDNVGLQERWFASFPHDCTQMYVPGCWNNDLSFFSYVGVAWYRYSFFQSDTKPIRLRFHAVSGFADVYLDGTRLGKHFGGFTPFDFLVEQLEAGWHQLTVRVDSSLNRETVPIDPVDWYHYGGIIRPVELQELSRVFIDKLRITYRLTLTPSPHASVEVSLQLRSLSSEDREVPVSIDVDNCTVFRQTVKMSPGSSQTLTFSDIWDPVRLWNVGHPELYLVRAFTDEDDIADRVGVRKIEARDKKIFINGDEVYLKGINRHEEHPEWGFAVPPSLMHKDLQIIKNLGCNAVRGSHYPQSPYWVDLLDEQGLVFWSEIPIWGALMPKEVLCQPFFVERALTMLDEMIERDFHHPSIVFWSVHNEIDTTSPEGYEISRQLTSKVRTKDPDRLVAYATMHPFEDIVAPLFDVIGVNKYYGWYEGTVEGFSAMLRRLRDHLDSINAGDKPVLMTEFGADGLYGDTGWEARMFSEDYQATVLESALRIFAEDPRVVGAYVWQFADIRAALKSDSPYFRDRARSFNNKGILNEYRKPKLAARVVRDAYQAR